MEVDGLQKIHHVQIEDADAVHARIDCKVILGDHPVEIGFLAQGESEFLGDDRGDEIVRENVGNGAHGRLREHENGSLDAVLAQLDALLDRRDGELVDACLKRRAGYMHGTVPVAVRLDDCHDLAVEPDALANDTDVVRNRVQVDLDPRPTRDVLTGIAFLELELIAIDMLMLVHRIFAERTAHAGMRPKIVDLVRAHELSSASRSRRTEPILQIISSGITAWTLNSRAAALPARP